MKILHAYHKNKPDHRIEREAYIAKQQGHQIIFLGMGAAEKPQLDVFDDFITIRSVNNREVATDESIRSEWAEVVSEIDPDIIHANDIIAAHFSSKLKTPMVYDDREYWSWQRIQFKSWPMWKRIAIRPFTNAIPKWEKELISKYVTITVSEGIAAEQRKISPNIFVLRNFGLLSEFKDVPINPNREGIAYVGSDYNLKKFAKHRDLTGVKDLVSFDVFSGLPRQELYNKLSNYRFGLLPFRYSDYHKYVSASKTYDYLNCGLQVIMTRVLYEAHDKLPFTYPFDEFTGLQNIIDNTEYVNPKEILEYSHKNLVWETQGDLLQKAYVLALELHE
ncbi:MAG: hypothetical protein E4H14_16510 [Candidatus Thorarchaeota archaeon]|nr:MAG: hypothetical protein E4H14_16510 [Candidatus Thorarchaeota archaeon]